MRSERGRRHPVRSGDARARASVDDRDLHACREPKLKEVQEYSHRGPKRAPSATPQDVDTDEEIGRTDLVNTLDAEENDECRGTIQMTPDG